MKLLSFFAGIFGLGLVTLVSPVAAQPSTDKEVKEAVDRGVDFLKKLQSPEGVWPHEYQGATSLAAYTLLECGVSPNDPIIRKAAGVIRKGVPGVTKTYDAATAILFLDRLGDPDDLPLIEALSLMLMASQTPYNGWHYVCEPLPKPIQDRLGEHLKKQAEGEPRKLPEKPGERKPRDPSQVSKDIMEIANAINRAPVLPQQQSVKGDNSNTHLALLALWVARRAGMPTERALARGEARYRAMQAPSGGWVYAQPGAEMPSASMTSAGLLSLAIGHAVRPPNAPKMDPDKDTGLKGALVAISASIGEPGQERDKLVLQQGGKTYYFLWTLERVGLIYGLKTIGGKDWHAWGTDLLLANQNADGSWRGEFEKGGCDTCFALLFLKKANIAEDLSSKLKDKVKDPGKIPEDLLDKIGREIQPGVDLPKKKQEPKKNGPEPQQNLSEPMAPGLRSDLRPELIPWSCPPCCSRICPFCLSRLPL
jgi:hypothetical protein